MWFLMRSKSLRYRRLPEGLFVCGCQYLSLLNGYQLVYLEGGGRDFLRNFGKHVPDYMISHHKVVGGWKDGSVRS
jgi:hypothetical protein